MTHKKRLSNIYKAAHFHECQNRLRQNDLLSDDVSRTRAKGLADAFAYIKQMIVNDQIGSVDYYKVYKISDPTFPTYLR